MQAMRKPFNCDPNKSMVYTKSLSFAKGLYDISEHFPDDVIREKMRNLAVSIATNIAQSRLQEVVSKLLLSIIAFSSKDVFYHLLPYANTP
jgi:hypothetical protein